MLEKSVFISEVVEFDSILVKYSSLYEPRRNDPKV